MAPPEHVSRVENHFPSLCEHCGSEFAGDSAYDLDPIVHQVTDLPLVMPEVVEHRRHRLHCSQCKKATVAPLPAAVPAGSFGSGVEATVAYYTGARRLSRREVVRTMHDLHHVDLSLGAVKSIEERVSAALSPCVEEAREAIQQSQVVHQDETGWREANQKAWLWVAATAFLAVFVVARSRSGDISRSMLGAFKGFLVTDRFKGYLWYEMAMRAICWAHLKRDFQRMVDRGGAGRPIGEKLLDEQARLFEAWHKFLTDEIDGQAFYRAIKPIRARMMRWLRLGTSCGDKKTQGACKDLLRHFPAFWTFIYEEGVDPTNNHAERLLRKAVLWRKGSYGTQSRSGSRFVERILTVVESCRLQGRSMFQFLVNTLRASVTGLVRPSLLVADTT